MKQVTGIKSSAKKAENKKASPQLVLSQGISTFYIGDQCKKNKSALFKYCTGFVRENSHNVAFAFSLIHRTN